MSDPSRQRAGACHLISLPTLGIACHDRSSAFIPAIRGVGPEQLRASTTADKRQNADASARSGPGFGPTLYSSSRSTYLDRRCEEGHFLPALSRDYSDGLRLFSEPTASRYPDIAGNCVSSVVPEAPFDGTPQRRVPERAQASSRPRDTNISCRWCWKSSSVIARVDRSSLRWWNRDMISAWSAGPGLSSCRRCWRRSVFAALRSLR